jgi:hypothetical protein
MVGFLAATEAFDAGFPYMPLMARKKTKARALPGLLPVFSRPAAGSRPAPGAQRTRRIDEMRLFIPSRKG